MRINSIDLITGHLPFHAPFRISLSEAAATDNVFVRITTDSGESGIGEASPSPAITGDTAESMLAAGRHLGKLLLGADAGDLGGADRGMARALQGHPTIRSAFDMALHDLAARACDVPLYRLLGGANRRFPTDNTVGLDKPIRMAEQARAFVEDGYPAVKAKVGESVTLDVERITRIREAIGATIPIRIDANQGWSVPAAQQVLRQVEALGVEYCEQPVDRRDLAGLRRLRTVSSIPIMADESVFDAKDALRLIRGECCDYLNIKLSKSAGIREAGKIAALAEAAGTACMVGCMSETRLGLSAAAHFICAHPVVEFADLDSHVDHTIDPVVGGVEISGHGVRVPDAPGLGADLDPEFVASCHVESLQS